MESVINNIPLVCTLVGIAGVVFWDIKEKKVLEQHVAIRKLYFPYIPGLLSFREGAASLSAVRKLKKIPDVLQITIQELPNWSSKNQLADLKEIRTINGLKGMDKSCIDVGMIGNKLYGACLGVNSLCFAYDEDIFKKAGVPIETRLINDIKPEKYAIEKAKEENFDLIVLGSRGHHSKLSMVLGTVANLVVNNAVCDVLIIR